MKMRNLFIGCVLALSMFTTATLLGGCALLNQVKSAPTTSAAVLVVLSDAQWGVSAAHDQTWITDAEYTLFEEGINVAEDAVKASSDGYAAVAKAALTDVLTALPATSRLRPYLDAAIILL